VGTGFSEKIMLKQKDESVIRLTWPDHDLALAAEEQWLIIAPQYSRTFRVSQETHGTGHFRR
jgi:hypothetical protein